MTSNPINRWTAFSVMLVLAFIVFSAGCAGSGEPNTGSDDFYNDDDQTAWVDQAALNVDDEIIGTGVVLSEADFDELALLSNPLSDPDWDRFFGPAGAGAKYERVGQADQSWQYIDSDTGCTWEITIALTKRVNNLVPASDVFDDGTYRWFYSMYGPDHYLSSYAPLFNVALNCLAGPWDHTTIGYGIAIIDYRVAYRLISGEVCEFGCGCDVKAEALYRSNMEARTYIGPICPFITRIANSYGVDRAQAVFNGKVMFDETAGAQSGDEVQVSIDVEMGGNLSSKDGVSVSGTVGQSETRNKDEGTADDFINGFGKDSSDECTGFIALNTGGKAFARHDARAWARSYVDTTSCAIYLVVDMSDCGGGVGWLFRSGSSQDQIDEDTKNLIRPFFEENGYSNYPSN